MSKLENEMLSERTWEEFINNGLLFIINQTLHLFGWCIVIEIEDDVIIKVYPARTKFRGFDEKSQTLGYKRITRYMLEKSNDLIKDIEEE